MPLELSSDELRLPTILEVEEFVWLYFRPPRKSKSRPAWLPTVVDGPQISGEVQEFLQRCFRVSGGVQEFLQRCFRVSGEVREFLQRYFRDSGEMEELFR